MNSTNASLKEAIGNQVSRLKSKVELIEGFKPTNIHTYEFVLDRINNKQEPDWSKFETELRSFGQFVYVIRTEAANASKVYQFYKDFKEEGKDAFRLSSNNEDIRKKKFDKVLYVGTSSRGMSSFKGRLREHLGIIGPKVYSLQLGHWFQPCPATIHVEVFPIEDGKKGILYDFENALWDFYQPLFGKKGVNVSSSADI